MKIERIKPFLVDRCLLVRVYTDQGIIGTGEAAKADILTQIKAAERLIDLIDIGAADQLGARIDAILAELQAIQTRNPLDALSSLGRAVQNLRQLRAQV